MGPGGEATVSVFVDLFKELPGGLCNVTMGDMLERPRVRVSEFGLVGEPEGHPVVRVNP